MATLYQKYRPSNFAEIVNQNHIKITLQNELETDSVTHAYLFSGPRGTGKTTIARVLAKAVNCEKREAGQSEPCGKCKSCEQITNGTSLDIIEIDAASHTGVDNVRENIIAQARIASSGDHYKIFIIDEVHMLSTSAFNALLKTLEEPPKKVIFILATTEVHKLPSTIISRCQRFDVKRINVNDIVKKLKYICQKENIKVEQGILETIARKSEGHMRDAESLLGQVFSISGDSITQEKAELVIPHSNLNLVIELIEYIAKKDNAQALTLINKLVDEGVELKNFTGDIIEALRRMLLLKVSPQLSEKFALELGQDLENRLQPIIQKITVEQLIDILEHFISAQNDLKSAYIIQLPLEVAVIKLAANQPEERPNTSAVTNFSTAPINPGAEKKYSSNSVTSAVLNIPIEDVKNRWNEVLINIKKHNHSLSFILKVCEPREVNKQLCLAFKYKFHQDRLNEATIKAILDKTLKEVFGQPMSFITLLDENLETNVDVSAINNNKPAEERKDDSKPETEVIKKNEVTKEVTPTKTTAGEESKDVKNVLDMFGGKVIS